MHSNPMLSYQIAQTINQCHSRGKNMKNTIQIILILITIIGLQACGDKKKIDTTDPKSPYYINHNDDKPMP